MRREIRDQGREGREEEEEAERERRKELTKVRFLTPPFWTRTGPNYRGQYLFKEEETEGKKRREEEEERDDEEERRRERRARRGPTAASARSPFDLLATSPGGVWGGSGRSPGSPRVKKH